MLRKFEYEEEGGSFGRNAALAAGGVIVAAALGFGVWQLMRDAGAPKRKAVQQISVVQPRELPKPPPPEQQEKPKEEIKEKIDTPPPDAKDDSPPPESPLKLEGTGGSSSDGFGMQSGKGSEYNVLRPAGTGDGRRGFGFYTNQLQSQLQEELNRKDKLRGAEYRAAVAVWIAADGRVDKVQLTNSTGNPQIDALIVEAITASAGFKAPPEAMPQPVRLRVTARGAG